MFQKMYRKFVLKHFGSTKNFVVWAFAVVFTIYVIDTFVLTRDRLDNIVNGEQNAAVIQMQQVVKDHGFPSEKVLEQKQPEEKPKESPKEKPAVKADNVGKGDCGLSKPCPSGQISYYLRSGSGRDSLPTICWNGHNVISPEKKNADRGVNMVVINEKSKEVEDIRTFDTYAEDKVFNRYLKLGLKDHRVILVASMDEITNFMTEDSKHWLQSHGASDKITDLKFREGYLMVGQRGLIKGNALEMVGKRDQKEFAETVEMSGCLAVPMGKLSEVKPPAEEPPPPDKAPAAPSVQKAPVASKEFKRGEEAPSCGVKDNCGSDAFPVHLYTGMGNTEGPKICVSGKYVLAKGLNDGGRGLNIVIADPNTKDVLRVGHFDTYAEDSSNLEIFLEMMNSGEIILAVAHDDAQKRLSDHAKKLFNDLGSGLIQNLQFRDVWMLVGQKGIDGFARTEQLETRVGGAAFPLPIDKRLCVPTKLKGSKIKPDPTANKNEPRRKFCAKYDGYGDFCIAEHVDENLTPAPLIDKDLENHKIFDIPIIVIPGLNHNAVRMQLETLLLNPGIRADMVTVMYDEKFPEPGALAEVFHFKAEKLSSSTKYMYQVHKALERVWSLHPKASHVIVLEEEVIVGMDFLYFFVQCLPVLDKDDSLAAVSAWNINGYKESSGLTGVLYRSDDIFPGLAFLLKKSYYDRHIKGKEKDCCVQRSWHGWLKSGKEQADVLVPDVSRVYRRPYEGLSEEADLLTELFNRDRITNLDSKAVIEKPMTLTLEDYDKHLSSVIAASTALDTTNVGDCLQGLGLGFYVPQAKGKSYVVYFEQSNSSDFTILSRLCKCFSLFHMSKMAPRGLYRSSLRFSYRGNQLMFIGSSSPYYRSMPKGYKAIQRTQL